MIDDLVTRGVSEPYRMFTSRAEYRLSLRADNADLRLTPIGIAAGCVGSAREVAFREKDQRLAEARAMLEARSLTPNAAEHLGIIMRKDGVKRSAFTLLSLPDVGWEDLVRVWPELGAVEPKIAEQVSCDARYAVYLDRQSADIEALKADEALILPQDIDYATIPGLSTEVRQKLAASRPGTLAQAGRIDGVTPAALTRLLAYVRRGHESRDAA
jgi:tRNA uridine 5-carboxymethylaminomethyl modification enzyme